MYTTGIKGAIYISQIVDWNKTMMLDAKGNPMKDKSGNIMYQATPQYNILSSPVAYVEDWSLKIKKTLSFMDDMAEAITQDQKNRAVAAGLPSPEYLSDVTTVAAPSYSLDQYEWTGSVTAMQDYTKDDGSGQWLIHDAIMTRNENYSKIRLQLYINRVRIGTNPIRYYTGEAMISQASIDSSADGIVEFSFDFNGVGDLIFTQY